jgi:hypothetical protein
MSSIGFSLMSPVNPATKTALLPAETARYTQQMLESLQKIAIQQKQAMLAHLLQLAAFEAKAQGDQETSLPG